MLFTNTCQPFLRLAGSYKTIITQISQSVTVFLMLPFFDITHLRGAWMLVFTFFYGGVLFNGMSRAIWVGNTLFCFFEGNTLKGFKRAKNGCGTHIARLAKECMTFAVCCLLFAFLRLYLYLIWRRVYIIDNVIGYFVIYPFILRKKVGPQKPPLCLRR